MKMEKEKRRRGTKVQKSSKSEGEMKKEKSDIRKG